VKATTALLADAAAVEASGKLYVHGGGWEQIFVHKVPAVHPSLALVLVFELSWDESNEDIPVHIELIDEDGHPVGIEAEGTLNVGRPPGVKKGGPLQAPLVLPLHAVTFQKLGGYQFRVTSGDAELVTVPFRVVPSR
jgi:hypothetical protein